MPPENSAGDLLRDLSGRRRLTHRSRRRPIVRAPLRHGGCDEPARPLPAGATWDLAQTTHAAQASRRSRPTCRCSASTRSRCAGPGRRRRLLRGRRGAPDGAARGPRSPHQRRRLHGSCSPSPARTTAALVHRAHHRHLRQSAPALRLPAKVAVQRIPQVRRRHHPRRRHAHHSAWDGTRGGVVAFRARASHGLRLDIPPMRWDTSICRGATIDQAGRVLWRPARAQARRAVAQRRSRSAADILLSTPRTSTGIQRAAYSAAAALEQPDPPEQRRGKLRGGGDPGRAAASPRRAFSYGSPALAQLFPAAARARKLRQRRCVQHLPGESRPGICRE